jgi:hypothetical protein
MDIKVYKTVFIWLDAQLKDVQTLFTYFLCINAKNRIKVNEVFFFFFFFFFVVFFFFLY